MHKRGAKFHAINRKKHFVVTTGTNLFHENLNSNGKNISTGVWGSFFINNVRPILLECRKAIGF